MQVFIWVKYCCSRKPSFSLWECVLSCCGIFSSIETCTYAAGNGHYWRKKTRNHLIHLKTDFPLCPLSGLLIKKGQLTIFLTSVLKDKEGKTGFFITELNHIQIRIWSLWQLIKFLITVHRCSMNFHTYVLKLAPDSGEILRPNTVIFWRRLFVKCFLHNMENVYFI